MINNCVFMGRLTHSPKLNRVGDREISKATFSIAVERPFNREQVDYIRCVAWRQTAEFISTYFSKGQMIAVTGSLQIRKYTDRDGIEREIAEVIVENASFCGSKAESKASEPEEGSHEDEQETRPESVLEDDDDELPF